MLWSGNLFRCKQQEPKWKIHPTRERYRAATSMSTSWAIKQKIEYLKNLFSKLEDGRLNLDILPSVTDEEVITTLQQVKETM